MSADVPVIPVQFIPSYEYMMDAAVPPDALYPPASHVLLNQQRDRYPVAIATLWTVQAIPSYEYPILLFDTSDVIATHIEPLKSAFVSCPFPAKDVVRP